MSKQLLEFDITKTPDEHDEDYLINIELCQEKHFKFNFSKLFLQSRYIRDKYKYSEAISNIYDEFSQLQKTTKIKERSIEHFLKYIDEGKVRIRYDEYHDMYNLSKHFEILQLTRALDEIFRLKMCEDLNFSIDTLIYSEQAKEEIEKDFLVKAENFLSERINESLSNNKFGCLPISIIYRIVEQSNKESLNINVLTDFIFESIESRFVLLKFVELDKINNKNFDKFIQFFDEGERKTKRKYLEYMSFNFSFIKEMKDKYDELANLFNKKDEEFLRTKEELKEKEKEIEKIKEELNRIKSAKSIVAAGYNEYNEFGVNPNYKDIKGNCTVLHPPQNLPVEPSSLLSYSSYWQNAILITRNFSLQGIGENKDCRMSSSLPKTNIKEFTEISMNDRDGQPLVPVSAVCGDYYTLFMFSKKNEIGNQLVFCDKDINGGSPVFLDIGNKKPLSLFGGRSHSAAISSDGEMIFINRDSVKNSPSARIESFSLPDGEKAKNVACGHERVFALGSKGGVFSLEISSNSGVLKFSKVDELSGKEIVWLSGTNEHFFAVSKEGRVFGCGSNSYGQLGLGIERSSVSKFTEISSLFKYEIRSAYAGYRHSLFETREGKILSCGFNGNGELLLSSGPSEPVHSPEETTITHSATFCIAGGYQSSVFIGGDPPPNTPNMTIKFNE